MGLTRSNGELMSQMTYTDGHNKEVFREVNETIDIRQFEGTPGYALLVIAANTHLSRADIWRWLRFIKGVERGDAWIRRRRWLFQQPGESSAPGTKPNADGKDKRALTIMRDTPRMSVRALARLLAQHGIKRGREFVRQNRCR